MTLETQLVQVVQAIGADVKALRAAATVPISGAKTLNYTAGVLTSVNGPGAATKTLTYTAGALTQVQSVSGGVTTTKVFNYSAGDLVSISTSIS